MIEVEMKFKVEEIATLERRVNEMFHETFSAPVLEQDTFFLHQMREFLRTDECLRIRQCGRECWLTYKGPRLDATTKTREELEFPLAPGRNSPDWRSLKQDWQTLLERLGFQAAAYLEKSRRTCHFIYQNLPIEMTLDTVMGLGTYTEIETIVPASADTELEAIREIVRSLARDLHLGQSIRSSYLNLVQKALLTPDDSKDAPVNAHNETHNYND